MALTSKQAKFVASYQINHNSTESAINAGYSVKTAGPAGCRLLKIPKIINELEQWRVKKRAEISKEDFVDLALKDYAATPLCEANRPRYLDLAGKALKYTTPEHDSRPNQTLNITINNPAELENKNQVEIWDITRKMLSD